VAATQAEHRTGFVQADESITSALSGLTAAYSRHPNADVAHWLISGYLATGEVEKARLYIQDARLRFPEDSRFLVLDGIVAYRTNDLDRAEKELEKRTHEVVAEIDELLKHKEAELLQI
jgi:Flp pilus assembly protein TadD